MKVWVTRSRPGADRQAADLRAAGHEPVVVPVIAIDGTGVAPPAGPFQTVVFLSEHAVRLGLEPLTATAWFAPARVLAVGARTAAVLAAAGVAAATPDDATSEGLLAAPALSAVAGQAVLLVCGVGGRDLLAGELARRGAAVARFECYRRTVLSRVDTQVLGCDVIIAASGDGLRQAARLWLAAGGRPDVPVLVPSSRVAALGVEVGLTRLHDCGGADSDAWLSGLKQMKPAGTP